MLKRGLILLALVATLAVPFLLRPHRASPLEADDTIVLVSPHNEAIRHEFSVGFQNWYKAKTGRTVFVDWRNVGGTSEIARYLESEYVASFRTLWTGPMGRPWSVEVQSAFQNPRLPKDAPRLSREARQAFLDSSVGCGIDLFFGGGPFDFQRQGRAGRLVDSGIERLHPDWFSEQAIPRVFQGQQVYDPEHLWYGTVLSCYGILYNRDALSRLGFKRDPESWSDLTDPRYLGQIGMSDPTKSGSIAQAFDNVVQQQMHQELESLIEKNPGADPKALTGEAVRRGWIRGLKLLQLVGANARYFTDTSQKPPIDVAAGDCAAGMCIDFYGREQQEAVRRRTGGPGRLGYVSPIGGSAYSVDPVALLRGAPHPQVALAFIEYVLSLEGQKIWNFKVGTPGGPQLFALRRLPVRKDFYEHKEWRDCLSDPEDQPYAQKSVLIHRDDWTGALFQELAFISRVISEDCHPELVRAWRAICAAPEPARTRALEALQDLSLVSYDQALGPIKKALGSKNLVDEIRLSRDLDEAFRRNYERAERIALGRE